ncbi:Oidioi.mRNA.OKI2018_I69.XSR.g15247.t3.cds [Oikopleura dioica]|uniref:Oidioi.mRNA.OKI2018_I69.XSR.g15247.t3.cds n=1 Tax=Oikopleura dioica TaxID=34765 RepID=A0ABN7SC76_OIKDI|nr:Oidioi.mRNA.OKI2018_I69.XSR.g15247.t3.cds [Oikopleura dioica]
MMLSILTGAFLALGRADEIRDSVEIDFQDPVGIKEEPLELKCRYRLPESSTLTSIYFALGEYSGSSLIDPEDIIVSAEGVSGKRNWYGDWPEKSELEHNEDLDGWRVAVLRILSSSLEFDQAKFTCGLTAQDIPRPISSEAVVTAEVQVRPDEILFQHDIKEKTLFVSCGAENGKPYASASIIIDEKLGRTINGNDLVNASYQLTKAFDGKAVTCEVAHPTYVDGSIVQEFRLGAPKPSSSCGQTQTETCETVETGELAIVAVEMTREGDQCSFYVSSSSPVLQPPATLRWEGPEEDPSFEFDSKVANSVNFTTSAFDNTTAVTVVAESILGASAVAFVFRDHCLPIPTTTAAVSETTTVVNDVTTGGHRPSNDYESVVLEGQGRSAGSFSLGRIINFILFVNMNLTDLNRPLDPGLEDEIFYTVSPEDEAEMAGAIVAAIVLGSLAVVFIIAAAIYFMCFNKHEEAYRPNEKDSDLDDITSSVDLNEVAETKKTASVKRSKSGTWNVPNGEENASLLANSSSLHSAPKRTTSTQTLPESEKYDQTVTLKENAVFASTESVHV